MVTVINTEEVRRSGKTPVFEGYRHGDVPVSFFLVDAPPGGGPRLHRHPYAEVFVVQEGRAIFTAGSETREVTGGHVVIVPPGMSHKFVNSGHGPLRMVNIHPTGQMVTEWLEG
ncbi:MAG TPA: cupin domain-containing protein [Chloroflexota bacterium]|nr:cupin domain-containing protein [Chloroflexota bacterium]